MRWLELLGERRRQRVEALRRELAAEGGAVPDDRERADPPPEGRPEPSPPRPQTREDVAFRREVAGRLVSAWLESCRLDKPEGRLFLETAMANIPGFRQVGEEGERVGFDAKYHDAEAAVSTGSPVRVVRPGWVLQEEDGEYRLAAAKVSP